MRPEERVVEGLRTRLHALEDELSRLKAELAETSTGVTALHAELDDHAEALRQASYRMGLLSEVSEAVASLLETDLILDQIGRLLVPATADVAVFCVPERDELRCSFLRRNPGASAVADAVKARFPLRADTDEPAVRVWRSGEGELVQAAGDAWSSLAVPVLDRGTLLGVLWLVSDSGRRRYTDEDLSTAAEIGARLAAALGNAARFEHERDVAATLQRVMLPDRLPSSDGLRLSAAYLAATQGLSVGGDWYDALRLPDGRIALVVGDVAGHGLDAAAEMGALRTAVRAYLMVGGPAETVAALRRLVRTTNPGVTGTVLVSVLDPATGALTICNAGSPPPLLVMSEGARPLAIGRSPMLGVEADDVEEQMTLDAGASLVIYTDGAVETRGGRIADGIERLAALVSDARLLTAESILAGLAERPLEDDVCILVATWSGPDRERSRSAAPYPRPHG